MATNLVQTSDSYDNLRGILSQLVSKEFITEFSEKIHTAMLEADSIGRSYVVEKDKFYSDKKKVVSGKFRIGKYYTRAESMVWIAAADNDNVRISFDLTPDDALAEFRKKAFWISGIENQKFIDAVKMELERALGEGTTYSDFTARFHELFVKYGITPEKPIRLDTIFRTNLFTAYTAGQVRQVDQVKDRFPAWRYVSILDNRTRQSHRELNDKLFRFGPFPPIDFNCRCTPQFIHKYQMDASPVYNSIFDFIDPAEVVDFLSPASYQKWIDDNPVSGDIQSIIEGNL